MVTVKTQDAVGMILCHDVTRIIKDKEKGPLFRKGHVIQKEDIPLLLDIGKENLFVWEKIPGLLHEDEGAERLRMLLQGENMHPTQPKEGKISLISDIDGLFIADIERLRLLNSQNEMMCATRSSGFPVKKGAILAGLRVIPLAIEEEKLNKLHSLVGDTPILDVKPFKSFDYGVITTGNEVLKGRIKDTFTPVVEEKLKEYSQSRMLFHEYSGDEQERITDTILEMDKKGAELIICTGGMSVDPDDRTPLAIRKSGAEIISYGSPVLPGAMLLVGYLESGTPILGLPGCVMYSKRTVFDLVLPRILAGVRITKEYLSGLGNGGLCLECKDCRFPDCSFGRGV